MDKLILSINYNRILQLAEDAFFRICPLTGSQIQQEEQLRIFSDLKMKYPDKLYPKIECSRSDEVYFKDRIIQIESEKIELSGLPCEKQQDTKINRVICYAMCIAQTEEPEETDILEKFYLDCFMTALLDASRIWLWEYLNEKERKETETISASFGPGFFGIGMEQITWFLEVTQAEKIGIKWNNSSMFPAKSGVGMYVVQSGDPVIKNGDCEGCLSSGLNCLFCMNSVSNMG